MPRGNADYRSKRSPFLNRHKRWFDFVGTIVVAGTFIVNEGLRNESKDLADSIDSAESSFSIRTEIESVAKQLLEVDKGLIAISNRLNKTPSMLPPSKSQTDTDVMDAVEDYPFYLQYVSIFDNIMRLYRKLPYDKALDEEHWRLTSQMILARQYLQDASRLGFYLDLNNDTEATKLKAKLAEETKAIEQENPQARTPLLAGVDLFGNTVLERAKAVHQDAEDRARHWKHISYGLYPLGLLISLLGKVYGGGESIGE